MYLNRLRMISSQIILHDFFTTVWSIVHANAATIALRSCLISLELRTNSEPGFRFRSLDGIYEENI